MGRLASDDDDVVAILNFNRIKSKIRTGKNELHERDFSHSYFLSQIKIILNFIDIL